MGQRKSIVVIKIKMNVILCDFWILRWCWRDNWSSVLKVKKLTRKLRRTSTKRKNLWQTFLFSSSEPQMPSFLCGGHTTRSVQCPLGGIKRVVTLLVIKDSCWRPSGPTPVKKKTHWGETQWPFNQRRSCRMDGWMDGQILEKEE